MRLSTDEVQVVRQLVYTMLGDADVWLFGSRVRDAARGGDVDLYIEAGRRVDLTERLRLMSRIQRAIGLRKVDLIIRSPDMRDRAVFHAAKETGILL